MTRTLKISLAIAMIALGWACSDVITDPIAENEPPIANAGNDLSVDVGETVELNALNSSDADNDNLKVLWEIVDQPVASNASLANADQFFSSFIPDVEGDYTVSLTVSDEINEPVTDEIIVTASKATLEISQNISEDITLVDVFDDGTPDYRVTRGIEVLEAATLTIEPGVIVEFVSDAYLDISGTLLSSGTATQKVILTGVSESKGFWSGVFIFSNNTNNLISNTEIKYAGGAARGFGIASAAVGVNSGDRLTMTNSTISDSDGYGIYFEGGSKVEGFENNSFLNNEGAPIALDANNVHKLDDNSSFSGNGNGYVEIFGSTLDLTTEVTWMKVAENLPYRVTGNLSVESGLKVMSGVVVTFGSGVYMQLDQGSNGPGYLITAGTEESKVIFTGATETPGFWMGIQVFTNDTRNKLDHTVVQYGGSAARGFGLEKANLAVNSGDQITITNSAFNSADGYGVFFESGAKLGGFSNSSCSNNVGRAAAFDVNTVHEVDGISSFNTGNGDNSVEIKGSTLEKETLEVSWTALSNNTAYYLSANLSIESGLVLDEGVSIEVGTDKYIDTDGDGYLIADGASAGISITGRTKNAGAWVGFQVFTNDTRNLLNNVTISHGGSSARGFGLPKSNIAVNSSDQLTVTNCTITDCDGTGLFGESGASVTQSGNVFTNNVLDIELN
ncbi:MAG: hypothetical protein ACI9XJ_000239 [Marivirga sp.]|jgi:hypothetical protein